MSHEWSGFWLKKKKNRTSCCMIMTMNGGAENKSYPYSIKQSTILSSFIGPLPCPL